ncbi:MAG: TOBE domain-containing protein, partial [Chloroflexi bacterium]|nr:TOBE domain-containing protein [Chloroflexota bacterium]
PRVLYEAPVSRQVAQFLGDANLISGTARGRVAETALGDVPLRTAADGAVEVMIRPEALILGDMLDGALATVQRTIYHGAHQTVWLALADGTLLKALAPADVEWRAGEQVRVGVRGAALAYPV